MKKKDIKKLLKNKHIHIKIDVDRNRKLKIVNPTSDLF